MLTTDAKRIHVSAYQHRLSPLTTPTGRSRVTRQRQLDSWSKSEHPIAIFSATGARDDHPAPDRAPVWLAVGGGAGGGGGAHSGRPHDIHAEAAGGGEPKSPGRELMILVKRVPGAAEVYYLIKTDSCSKPSKQIEYVSIKLAGKCGPRGRLGATKKTPVFLFF